MAGKFEIKSGKTGKFRFNLKASNGQIVLTSEAYDSRAAAVKGIASVKNNAGNAKRFERKTAKDGSPYFVMKAANGEPIGRSEMYKTKASMENGVASVAKHAPDAPVADGGAAPAPKAAPKAAAKRAAKKTAAKKPAAKSAAKKTAAKPAAKKSAAKPAAKKAAVKKPAAKPAAKKTAAKKPAAKSAAKKTAAKPAVKKTASKKPAAKKPTAKKKAKK
ncbi:MAG: YegP family protein [Acidobacteriota bacterium]